MEKNKNFEYWELAKTMILDAFNFLEAKYQYKPQIEFNKSNFFIEDLDVKYVSIARKREVKISYTSGNSSGQLKYTFGVAIIRSPYREIEDFFSLSVYLNSIGNVLKSSLTKFEDHEVKEVLKAMGNTLQHDVHSVIKGDIWLDKYYPRKD